MTKKVRANLLLFVMSSDLATIHFLPTEIVWTVESLQLVSGNSDW